jgi:quercetin dioxygenase-like cupin family protein
MTASTRPTPALPFLDCHARILADAAVGDGRTGLVELAAPSGHATPRHRHDREDEGFFVLEGEVTLEVAGAVTTLRAGDFLLAPRGVPHALTAGAGPARWLVTCSPTGFPAFVAAVAAARPATDAALAHLAAAHAIHLLDP